MVKVKRRQSYLKISQLGLKEEEIVRIRQAREKLRLRGRETGGVLM